MKAEAIYGLVRRERIIAIVRGVGPEQIVDVAEALLAGGIKMLEVTCNTEGAFEMIEMLSKEMAGEMTIGAGTVITPDLCARTIEAGAKYIIAPDVNPEVIEYCVKQDVAVLPGAHTATEVLTAKRHGARMVKMFPAAAIGVDYIKALRGPIDNVDFVAVGGVRTDNIADFFKVGCVAIAIGGSIIKKEFVEQSNWQAITDGTREYVEILAGL